MFGTGKRWIGTIAFALPVAAGAQVDTAQSARDTTAAKPAVVVVGRDTILTLYGSLGPFDAPSRAAAANERIRLIAPGVARGDSFVVTNREGFSELAVGDRVIMTVLDADAIPVGADRVELATRYAAALRAAILASAERVSPRALLLAAGLSILATALLIILLRLIGLGWPKLYRRVESMRQVKMPALRIQDFELLSGGRLSVLILRALGALRFILTVFLLYVYVPLLLSFWPWTAALSERIVGYALRPFAAAGLAFVVYLPNLFYLAAGVIIVRYTLRLLRTIFNALKNGTISFDGFYPEWADPTYKIVRVAVLALSATVLYPYLPGASSDAFKGVSIFVGVLFSLGSSAAIGNMVAGIVLTYTRSFNVGDRVKIGDTVGDVTEKTLLVTRLRTIKNTAVTIPNGNVLGGQVINYTTLAASRGLILHTTITIGYDAPWRQVHELLISAALNTEGIEPEPPPFVLQTSLDDFYVSYQINATTNRAEAMAATYSLLHQQIQEAFNTAGVEIMSPHYRALRDGPVTIPAAHLPPDHQPSGIEVRVTQAGGS